MALNAFLKLKGAKQGDINGGSIQKGREGKIVVVGANHEVLSPSSGSGGAAIGKRVHKPFVIIKLLDKSSPLLYNALVNNENLVVWELQFFTNAMPGQGPGMEKQHYTVKLTNARITDIRFIMADNKFPDLAGLSEYEEVEFVYQSIEWTWVDGGITAKDDWSLTNV